MSEKYMKGLKAMLCAELDDMVSRGTVNLDRAQKLTDTIKNIDKIERLDEEYSYGRYNDGMSRYGYDQSGARGRHYVRGHYSYDDGRYMVSERIEDMLEDTTMNPGDKDTLRKALEVIRR